MCGSFVIHTPTPINEFKLTILYQSLDFSLSCLILFLPPSPEKCNFHINKPKITSQVVFTQFLISQENLVFSLPLCRIFGQFRNHSIQDILYSNFCDVLVGPIVILIHSFEPSNIVMGMRYKMHIQKSRFSFGTGVISTTQNGDKSQWQ